MELPPATVPPLPCAFKSPWIGKSVEDCATWLAGMPPGTPHGDRVNRDNFIVMDENTIEDDNILTCCWKQGETGEIMVEYFPQPVVHTTMEMWTNDRLKWDEKATNYQRSRMMDGKSDRSRTFVDYR